MNALRLYIVRLRPGYAGGGKAVQGNISGAGHRGLCAEGVCASAEKAWHPEMRYVWKAAAR